MLFNIRTVSIFIGTLCLCMVACQQENNKNSGKKKTARELSIEVYIAEWKTTPTDFKTSGELRAAQSVLLKTETSGKLKRLAVSSGAKVSKNTLVAKIDDAEMQAQKKQAEATFLHAEQTLKRVEKLYESGSTTEVELEKAKADFAKNEAALELLKTQIAQTEIRAPFKGICGITDLSEGEWLNTGASVVSLTDISKLRVRFSIPQRYATNIKVGSQVSLTDEERNVSGTGKITAFEPMLSGAGRTRLVEAEINNADGKWLAGSFVSILVPFENHAKPTVSIPSEAVTLDDKGAYVFLIQGNKAVRTYVQTALRTPISVTVTDGVSAGDTIAVSGIMNLREGIHVSIKNIRNGEAYEVIE